MPHVRIGGRLRFKAADIAEWIEQRYSKAVRRPRLIADKKTVDPLLSRTIS